MNINVVNSLRQKPWAWVPSIFFMEGLPGIMIIAVIGIMYKNLDIPNSTITMYTGLLILPWSIRWLWAAFIDIFMTKRWWIYTMEITAGILFVVMGFVLTYSNFFYMSLIISAITAFVCTSHDVAADGMYIIGLKSEQQSFYCGITSVSYNVGKLLAQGAIVMLSGYLFTQFGNFQTAWSMSLILTGVICIIVGYYNRIFLPIIEEKREKHTIATAFKDYFLVFREFMQIKGLLFAIIFLFFYRIGEIFLGAILPLFLIDGLDKGGLGFTNQFTGFAYGIMAPFSIILGGLVGGWFIYNRGVRKSIWFMFIIMNVTHILYVFLAYFQITVQMSVLAVIAVEQFTYSFAYSAYYMFMLYCVKDSKYKTAHYAIFSAVMMLSMMLPKMYSGLIQEMLGYNWFFIFVLAMVVPGIFVVHFLKIDPEYGKKHKKQV